VRRLETFEENDHDSALKLIQFSTTIVENHLLDMHILRSVLSLVLSFAMSEDDLVSELSATAGGQIIGEVLALAESESQTVVDSRDIDLCFSISCDGGVEFENPVNKVVYLVLRDLARVACGQAAAWLRVVSLSPGMAYAMIETVIREHAPLLNSSAQFQRLIEEAAQHAFKQNAPLSFCVQCATVFVEALPSAAIAIFTDFLRQIRPQSPKLLDALLFFRVFLLQKGNVVVAFCLNCDRNGWLLGELIASLRAIAETAGETQINISITPRTVEYTISDPIGASVEIAVFLVQSCYQAQNIALKGLVLQVWSDILNIFTMAASIVSGKSCYTLLQGMHSLVVLTHELSLDDARGSAISAFCNILVTPNGPDAAEVKQIAYETATTAIDTAPAAFTGHWNKLMNAMALFEWRPSSPQWSRDLPRRYAVEVLHSLLTVTEGQEWAVINVVDILLVNTARFDELWPPVQSRFCADDGIILNAFLRLLREGFVGTSERFLCEAIEQRFALGVSGDELLDAIRQLLSGKATIISLGWTALLNALKTNFVGERLATSFRCVEVIANDLLHQLPGANQIQLMHLIFQYSSQVVDINLALSAFGLLWNIVSICTTAEMWKIVLRGCAELIRSPLNDVSACAVNTFFSLIISNSQSLPPEVFDFVARELFIPIVEFVTAGSDETAATQQLAFHELVHCGRTLWAHFKEVESFPTTFWHKLFAGHEQFIKRCGNRDVLMIAFQFYEEAFECGDLSPELNKELFDSLERVTDFLVRRENAKSPLYGAFGRMLRFALVNHRPRMTVETLTRWITILEKPIFELESGGILPPTSHKSMDAMIMICPMPLELSVLVYKSHVRMACNQLNNPRLRDIAIDHIMTLCRKCGDEQLPTFFLLSEDLFRLPAARKLLLEFVSRDIAVPDELLEHVSHSLMALGQSDIELREKTATSVLKLFTRLAGETQLQFLDVYRYSSQAISLLLTQYCDIQSDRYSEIVANLCTRPAIDCMRAILASCDDDPTLISLLKLLRKLRTNGRFFECVPIENQHFHLFVLLPIFADLVFHPNGTVKKQLHKILLRISSQT
jgi:hypothetical protein